MAISYFLNSTVFPRSLATPLPSKATTSWTDVSVRVPTSPIDATAANQNYWTIVDA